MKLSLLDTDRNEIGTFEVFIEACHNSKLAQLKVPSNQVLHLEGLLRNGSDGYVHIEDKNHFSEYYIKFYGMTETLLWDKIDEDGTRHLDLLCVLRREEKCD